ncbi:MAG: ABC transporter ATP-binding protein [Kiloniellaceae bacterium]
MADASTAYLRAVEITKNYGPVTALDRVSLDIAQGEFLTLLGPSGSGKTTFLMCLAGFVEASSGRLEEAGTDITRRPAEDRRYGMVFQGYALFPHMTVADNVAFPLRVGRMARSERKARVAEMLETVGLDGYGDRRPRQLSGGQQQRVALARALISHPPVLLLDEPLSALDKNLREQMQEEIKSLHRKTGSTFVFVTHDQTEALSMSSRVAIFNHGQLQQVGTPQEVYEHPTNRFVAEFLGRINLIPLQQAQLDGGRLTGRFEDQVLTTAAGRATADAPVIAVRPEYMRLSQAAPGAGENGIRATVRDRVYGGAHSVLLLSSASGLELSLDIGSHADLLSAACGEQVWITWPQDTGVAMSG